MQRPPGVVALAAAADEAPAGRQPPQSEAGVAQQSLEPEVGDRHLLPLPDVLYRPELLRPAVSGQVSVGGVRGTGVVEQGEGQVDTPLVTVVAAHDVEAV